VKERRWTALDLMNMDQNEFQYFYICLNARAFRMLGINWKSHLEFFVCPETGDYVVRFK
jgi:hypothetical protein